MNRLVPSLLALLLFAPASDAQVFVYAGAQSPIPASYFGITCGHPQIASPGCIPSGTFRTWDASGYGQLNSSWASLESASGVYNWTILDDLVGVAQTYSIPDIVYTIGAVPAFNSSNPSDSSCAGGNGTCDPNSSTTEFVKFMNAITQRYCGTIKYWEGWNEADSPNYWNDSISLLVSYMAAAYSAVHSTANCACVGSSCSPGLSGGVNPNQMLMPALDSPAFFTAQELNNGSSAYNLNLTYWLTRYLAAEGKNYYDIAALHSYGSSATCYATPETYVTDMASYKQVLATAGLPLAPIWATESNWGANTCVPAGAAQNAWIARYLLLHWAMGIQREIWYAYDASGSYGTIAPSSDQLRTYQEMQLWMTGAVEQNCQQFANNNWTCTLARSSPAGYQGIAVWNSTGSGSYTVPSGMTQYRNVLGTTTSTSGGSVVALTTSPLLFETSSAW